MTVPPVSPLAPPCLLPLVPSLLLQLPPHLPRGADAAGVAALVQSCELVALCAALPPFAKPSRTQVSPSPNPSLALIPSPSPTCTPSPSSSPNPNPGPNPNYPLRGDNKNIQSSIINDISDSIATETTSLTLLVLKWWQVTPARFLTLALPLSLGHACTIPLTLQPPAAMQI